MPLAKHQVLYISQGKIITTHLAICLSTVLRYPLLLALCLTSLTEVNKYHLHQHLSFTKVHTTDFHVTAALYLWFKYITGTISDITENQSENIGLSDLAINSHGSNSLEWKENTVQNC